MRPLTVSGLSSDGLRLVLRAGDELFELPLADVPTARQPTLPFGEPPPERPPSPREIQHRVRCGETSAEIAQKSGMPVEAVAKYEGPVLAEREYQADQARRSQVDGRVVGELVEEHVARMAQDPALLAWDCWLIEPGRWHLVARAGREMVRMRWDPVARKVHALDEPARQALRLGPVAQDALGAVLRPVQSRAFERPAPAPPGPRAESTASVAPPPAAARPRPAASSLPAPTGLPTATPSHAASSLPTSSPRPAPTGLPTAGSPSAAGSLPAPTPLRPTAPRPAAPRSGAAATGPQRPAPGEESGPRALPAEAVRPADGPVAPAPVTSSSPTSPQPAASVEQASAPQRPAGPPLPEAASPADRQQESASRASQLPATAQPDTAPGAAPQPAAWHEEAPQQPSHGEDVAREAADREPAARQQDHRQAEEAAPAPVDRPGEPRGGRTRPGPIPRVEGQPRSARGGGKPKRASVPAWGDIAAGVSGRGSQRIEQDEPPAR